MATPIQDKLDAVAANGVKRIVSDGEVVDMISLKELSEAADREAKQQASGQKQFGIIMKRVRMGGSYPS